MNLAFLTKSYRKLSFESFKANLVDVGTMSIVRPFPAHVEICYHSEDRDRLDLIFNPDNLGTYKEKFLHLIIWMKYKLLTDVKN